MKKNLHNQVRKDWKGEANSICDYRIKSNRYLDTGSRRRIQQLIVCLLWLNFTISSFAETKIVNVSTLIQAGKFDEATQSLQDLANSTKDIDQLSGIFHQLGEIHYSYTREYPKALNAYSRVIQLKAETPTAADVFLAHIKKGDVYCRMGQFDDAIRTYHSLLKSVSFHPFRTRNLFTKDTEHSDCARNLGSATGGCSHLCRYIFGS